jgi:hypothetical protein
MKNADFESRTGRKKRHIYHYLYELNQVCLATYMTSYSPHRSQECASHMTAAHPRI